MKTPRYAITTSLILLMVSLSLFNLIGNHLLANVVIILLVIPSWMSYRYSKSQQEQEKELARQIQHLSTQEANLYSQILDLQKEVKLSLDKSTYLEEILDQLPITMFSYDLTKEQLFISKGINDISMFSETEMMRNPDLLNYYFHTVGLKELLSLEQAINHQFQIESKDGNLKWLNLQTRPVRDSDGTLVKINGIVSDISEQKQVEEKLRQLAYYDDLTDIPNRKFIQKHLRKTIARSKRHQHQFGVMFIDLDGFKKVNDTMGHDCGDLLLIQVATRLDHAVREEDLTGRVGGDEFIIVFDETTPEEISKIAERIVTSISSPYLINEHKPAISPSIGISMFPEHGDDIETLIKNADKAMYHAKKTGKNNYKFFTEDLDSEQVSRFPLFEKIMNSVSQLDFFQQKKGQ